MQESAANNTLYVNNLNEKVGMDELKDALFALFEQYGEVVDIVAKRNIRMRGQAFIVFRDINSAMEAKRRGDAQQLFGKTIRVHFARQKSDVIAKLDGTFHLRERPDNYFQMKFEEKFVHRPQELKVKKEHEKNKARRLQNQMNLPNHILFCQGIDNSVNLQGLTEVFMRFPGLVDVRMAPKDYAFVEYEDEFKAGSALAALNDTHLGTATLRISYAKK